MRKGIELRVTLYLEGEDEPAHDFAASSMRAVREILAAGSSAHPELRVKVRRVVEVSDDDERGDD
jgi:hypothetical protein